MNRQLTPEQQAHAAKAFPLVDIVIRSFLKDNRQRRELARRCDLHGVAQEAVCLAALTYDPAKSGVSAYFSVAIHRALVKEIVARERNDSRATTNWPIEPEAKITGEKHRGRAMAALQLLSPYEKKMIEDHLIEGVTITRLAREQDLDWRTCKKRMLSAIEKLREAEKKLP